MPLRAALFPLLLISLVPLPSCASGAPRVLSRAMTPLEAGEELLAADRAFAGAAARTDVAGALEPLFADDVLMPTPDRRFAEGRADVVRVLRANPDNAGARLAWAPIRYGISADGQHGFTFGYMTGTRVDGSTADLKYLAYWVKGPDGWRIAAYRRRPRPAGDVPTSVMPPSLPSSLVAPTSDAGVIRQHGESLTAAEKAISDEAQTIGLDRAFAKHGRPDAVNIGGPDSPGFVVGSDAIGEHVGRGSPANASPVEWSADRVLVASSGDLGITFGMIRLKAPQPGQPSAVPFFTIWRREPGQPWRYIAE